MKLKYIAHIKTGLNYKSKDIAQHSGDYYLIQVKDVIMNEISKENINRIKNKENISRYILNNHDILFAAKGNKNVAVRYDNAFGRSVASSTFFIIRVIDDKVLPEYLSWYLNLKTTQEHIKVLSTGTFIPSINKEHLDNFEIPVPSLEIQKKIIAISTLRKKEKNLIKEINFKKDILIESILSKKISNSNE